jgi:hypothetical protein
VVLGPYRERIDSLLREGEQQPREQHFTARRIHELICEDGYHGSESTVQRHVGKMRSEGRKLASCRLLALGTIYVEIEIRIA